MAFALRAVFGVVGEVVNPAGAIVAIATRISSRDLMLAAIFDDVACAHIATRLSAPRRKPFDEWLGIVCGSNDETCGGRHVENEQCFSSSSSQSQVKKPIRFMGDISY